MAIKCPQCGAECDVTLFTFGRTIRCGCGASVDLAVGHQRPHEPRDTMGHVIWCYLLLLCLTGSVLARSPDRDENIVSLKPFVQFLKHDMQYGGCTVMLGVPTGWRTLDRDSLNDAKLHDVILQADIVSPWTVGRYASPESAARHGDELWRQDIEWCDRHAKQYMPVVFPGFSWHNMKPDSSLDRRRSRFSRCRRFGHQKVILVKPPEIGYHGGYGTAVHGS